VRLNLTFEKYLQVVLYDRFYNKQRVTYKIIPVDSMVGGICESDERWYW